MCPYRTESAHFCGSKVMTGMSHALLYLSFRMGGLGYGPRFRRCNWAVVAELTIMGIYIVSNQNRDLF